MFLDGEEGDGHAWEAENSRTRKPAPRMFRMLSFLFVAVLDTDAHDPFAIRSSAALLRR